MLCRGREFHDRKAVAVTWAEGYVVGHLPREISGLCFHFIKHGGEINGEITGRRQHMKAACGGMEIPCHLTLSGKKKLVKKTTEHILGRTSPALPLDMISCNVQVQAHSLLFIHESCSNCLIGLSD